MTHAEEMEDLGFDIDTGSVRKGRVLMQNTGVGPVFLSLGPTEGQSSEDYNQFFHAQCERIFKIAERGGLLKTGYNPDQPRIPAEQAGGGEWTNGNHGNETASDAGFLEDAAAQWWPTPADKQRFVDAHLAAAQKAADRLGVPVENVLGLAALEAQWGHSRFAVEGNNFFNLHAGSSYATGSIKARQSNNRVATFDSPEDSFHSFSTDMAGIVKSKQRPEDFAAALQNAGKFGIDPTTGSKIPTFVSDTAGTIKGLRIYIHHNSLWYAFSINIVLFQQ